jgi:hypothetical protein
MAGGRPAGRKRLWPRADRIGERDGDAASSSGGVSANPLRSNSWPMAPKPRSVGRMTAPAAVDAGGVSTSGMLSREGWVTAVHS